MGSLCVDKNITKQPFRFCKRIGKNASPKHLTVILFTEIFTRSEVFVTRILGRKAAPYSSRLRFQNKDTHTNIHTYIETGQAFNIDDQQYLKGRIYMFSFKKGQLQVNTSYKAIQLEIRT